MSVAVQGIPCPVCQVSLEIKVARGRKSGKLFLSLVCLRDGRHFRGFIADKEFIQGFIDKSQAVQGGLE